VVEGGVVSPPCESSGWVGATSTKELGARDVWRRPVRWQGRARGRAASARVANVAARSAPSWRLCLSTRGLAADSEAHVTALWQRCPSASARASDSAVRAATLWRRCSSDAANNVAASWRLRSSVSVSAADSLARAALWMSSRSMSARIASRGAARSSHVAWMRPLAASKRCGDTTSCRGCLPTRELAADSTARVAALC